MKNSSPNFFEEVYKNGEKTGYVISPRVELESIIEEFIFILCENEMEIETLPSTSVSFDFTVNGSITMVDEVNNWNIELPKAVAFGVTTRSFKFKFAKKTLLFVVKFKPGWAGAVINLPIDEMFEKFIQLDTIFDKRKISLISEHLKNFKTFEEIVHFMEDFLLKEIKASYQNEMIGEALEFIKEEGGLTSIKDLVEELCVERYLFDRKFKIQVGTTPKQYSKIIRFRSLFETKKSEESLIQLGLNAGYYDQAHFIKNFKSVTGRTPSQVL